MSVSKQLSNFLETNNMSLKDLSTQTGLPIRTLQSYIQNTRQPTTPVLTILAEKARININWLLTGQGNMFSNHPHIDDQTFLLVSSNELQLIQLCRSNSIQHKDLTKKALQVVELLIQLVD